MDAVKDDFSHSTHVCMTYFITAWTEIRISMRLGVQTVVEHARTFERGKIYVCISNAFQFQILGCVFVYDGKMVSSTMYKGLGSRERGQSHSRTTKLTI